MQHRSTVRQPQRNDIDAFVSSISSIPTAPGTDGRPRLSATECRSPNQHSGFDLLGVCPVPIAETSVTVDAPDDPRRPMEPTGGSSAPSSPHASPTGLDTGQPRRVSEFARPAHGSDDPVDAGNSIVEEVRDPLLLIKIGELDPFAN